MAAVEGFKFEQTLTGFKWLGNIAKQRQAQGLRVLFAFEEAIGFMFPDVGMVSFLFATLCPRLTDLYAPWELLESRGDNVLTSASLNHSKHSFSCVGQTLSTPSF